MIRWSWPSMGSVASLAVPGSTDPRARAELDGAVRASRSWLDAVEATLSPHRSSSDLCRWRADRAPLADFSPMLAEVVAACSALHDATGGGFEPVDPSGSYDPSGYVKGWAVQQAVQRLVDAGVTDACLGVGGDIQMRGTSEGGRPWRTALGDPRDRSRIAALLEQPAGGRPFAVATSGAAQRGAHIWGTVPADLRTPAGAPPSRAGTGAIGRGADTPVQVRLASITVVGPDLGRVDAFATAIWARALREPLADAWSWLAGTGCEALAIDATGQVQLTAGMRTFLHAPAGRGRSRVPALA